MAETESQSNTPKAGAPKDKNCPYCGQAFTSSSLGRHLDLYIKEKNAKPPDGIHDVDAIRKLRGGITRRQPRGSTGGRRELSTPLGTPRPSGKKGSAQESDSACPSPAIPKDGHYAVDSTLSKYPFVPRFESTGVINDLSSKHGDLDRGWDVESNQESTKRTAGQRAVSKQVFHKQNFDVKQKLADAMDTARAAELALRELLSSCRAAKYALPTLPPW
jgi:hypothetical protein